MRYGILKCKDAFMEVYISNGEKSVSLLNDSRLTFPCFFVLVTQIDRYNLFERLNQKNKIVFKLIKHIEKREENVDKYFLLKNEQIHEALKWIVETSFMENYFNNNYEDVIDVAVSLLINIYKDKSILPLVADLIFMRSKKGRCYHDLIWAYFQIKDPVTLKIFTKYLLSKDKDDVLLASNFLGIDTIKKTTNYGTCKKYYDLYVNWLKENDLYLYFTGESLQFTSVPHFCEVDLERKYINKGLKGYEKQKNEPENEREHKIIEVFKKLNHEQKLSLSNCSHKIHNTNALEWENWINSPIEKQLESVNGETEGFL